ncbi:MAG: hypothetical protein HYX38_06485 [Rhodospirillales bacterium]|nr:hypothetical protein [Rhodospirillales bacterium]
MFDDSEFSAGSVWLVAETEAQAASVIVTNPRPPLPVEWAGSTALTAFGGSYFLSDGPDFSGGLGPQLKIGGDPVTQGQFGGWAPVGAEQVDGGYQVAWKLSGTDQHQIWTVDSGGNFLSASGVVSGDSAVLQSAESVLQQDLNADGTTGLVTTVIESAGATALTQIADSYFLGESGPQLKIGGAPITEGQFGDWAPIGAEQVSGGYQVAWKLAGADLYQVWTIDGSGNLVSASSTVSGNTIVLQSAESVLHQDLNADGTTGPVTTPIESSGSTALVQIADGYFLGVSGPQLKIGGAPVTEGQFGDWAPAGAEQVGGGYQVAWKLAGADLYQIWTVDGSGNLVSASSTISGNSAVLQSAESVLHQDLNADGTTGLVTTAIESAGATVLAKIADGYFLGGSGPQLKIGGASITEGQFGGWAPIGAEQVGGGYQVAWKLAGADLYQVWTVDGSGNLVSASSAVSGNSTVLQSAESVLHQDLNDDGTIGPATTPIESSGSTALVQIADGYFLGVSGPQLKINGASITEGQFGGWVPVGAEQVGGGYQVAWKLAGADLYQVWTVNGSGNLVSASSTVTGSSTVLQSAESVLHQDLNADGTTGPVTTVIESSGSTALIQIADSYFLGGSGPQLKINGASITEGQFGGWAPVGAEQVGGGYQVAWKLAGADLYQVWTVDGSGNLVSASSTISGSSTVLQSAESVLHQDLNDDNTIGPVPTLIESVGFGSLSQAGDIYVMRYNGSEVVLKYAGVPVTAGQFPGWMPVGAENMGNSTQFRVAWKHVGTDEYQIWETDANGNYVSGGVVLYGSTYVFQSKEIGLGGQDVNGDGVAGVKSTVIENSGSSALTIYADTYGVGGVLLKYAGAPVTVGAFAGWTPIGGESGTVVWKRDGVDQYRVWQIWTDGSFGSEVTVSSSGYALQSVEASFGQDLNADGRIGALATFIDSSGGTNLSRVADAYVLTGAGGLYHVLSKDSAQVVAGQTGGWTPVGVEWTTNGVYQLVWKVAGADQFKIWDVSYDGKYISGDNVTMSGNTAAFEDRENSYGQDLNGDGTIGIKTTVIESLGATTLRQIADTFTVDGKTVKLNGAIFVAGQSGAWTPIGAETTAGIYQLALKSGSTDQYVVWTLDSDGNYRSSSDVMNGNALGAEYYEYLFQQDLNHDNQTLTPTVIESTGLTTLVKVGSGYFLNPSSGGRGPQLHVDGTVLSAGGQPGTWVPVAAEEWAEGFDIWDIAFKLVGSNSFREELARFDGDMAPFFGRGPTYPASSPEVEDIESDVRQDLNGDGVIGTTSITVESRGSSSLYLSTLTSTYHLGSRDGVELKINGVAVTGNDLWKPIAIEVGSNGPYQVTLKAGNLDQYQVGRTDGAGNFIASSLGILSGSSIELKIWETTFQQDLNGDGVIGIPDGVIEANGSATLVKQGSNFYAYQAGSATGVLLKSANGGPLTNNPLLANTYVPIGVDWTSDYGFQIVSIFTDLNVYKVDDADSTGKLMVPTIGTLQSDSMLLKAAEGIFQQDFNRDDTTGLPSTGAFDIDIHFHGDQGYRLYFEAAAQRWEQIITADLPDTVSMTAEYGTIDDVRIDVTVDAIDGRNGVLASAGWDELGNGWLPVHGNISIDSGDLSFMRSDNRLLSVIIHEIGHVLGIGTLWSVLGLKDSNGYIGQYGLEAYRQLSGNASATFVPLETSGGDGTAGAHWADSVFGNELMTGFISGSVNPLSILTIGALKDLGYAVDYGKADSYTMPA